MKEFPKKFKYGRVFRVKLKNKFNSYNFLNIWFYKFGLKALENGKLNVSHFKSFIRLIKRYFKKELLFRFNVALTIPVTQKPREARMGKGKGQRTYWECPVKKGMILFEFGGKISSKQKLYRVLNLVQEKLPISTKIVRIIY